MVTSEPPSGIGERRQMTNGRRDDDLERRDTIVRMDARQDSLEKRQASIETKVGSLDDRLNSLARQLWFISGGVALAAFLSGYVAVYVIQLQTNTQSVVPEVQAPADPREGTDLPADLAESPSKDKDDPDG